MAVTVLVTVVAQLHASGSGHRLFFNGTDFFAPQQVAHEAAEVLAVVGVLRGGWRGGGWVGGVEGGEWG